jgi:predicted DNA-binding protein
MMIRSAEKLKELKSILGKKDNLLISEAIELLREEKPFEGAIALLTSFYDSTEDYSIRKTIENFMSDLKDQTACTEVIYELRKTWKAGTTSMLVSSCWQSGLDYSDYSSDFAKIFISGDYVTAIECLTVIEESATKLSTEKKEEILKIIRENPPHPANEKTTLFYELQSILDR